MSFARDRRRGPRRASPQALALAVLACLAGAGACRRSPDVSQAAYAEARRALQAHLDGEVLPFWTSPELFRAGQGFVALLDLDLRPRGEPERHLIPQLRALYVHAVAGERATEAVERERIAAQTREILARIARYWDPEAGGFFDALGPDGRPEPGPKTTRAQAHALYLLAEAHRHGAPMEALQLARRTFDRLEARAHDARHGGYREHFELPPEDPRNALKTLTAHIHLLIGVARLEQVSPSPLQRERLAELLDLVVPRFEIARSGRTCEALAADWSTPPADPGRGPAASVYPHAAELLSYALVASEVLGRSGAELDPWLGRIAETLRIHAITGAGAVHHTASHEGVVLDQRRFWWSQAELLGALLRAHERTRAPELWEAFERVRRWTFVHMVPPGSGAWIATLSPAGERIEGMRWQTGFHVTRAILECEAVFDRLLAARAG